MSVEIAGFNPDDIKYTNTISFAGGVLCAGHGIEAEQAFTVGSTGAEYGAAIVFTTLRQMGVWPPEGFDADAFEAKAQEIVTASISPSPST